MNDFEKAWEQFKASNNGCECFDSFQAGWLAAKQKLTRNDVPYIQIISELNRVLGRSFRLNDAVKRLINARWDEGNRIDDFEKVCIIKKAQWGEDPTMAIYLRPQTLFGTKMDSYLNEPMPKQKKMIMNHLGIMVEVDDE